MNLPQRIPHREAVRGLRKTDHSWHPSQVFAQFGAVVETTAFKVITVIRNQDYQRVVEPRLAPKFVKESAEPGNGEIPDSESTGVKEESV